MSMLLGRTGRDVPTEAELVAHQLVVRAGLVRAMLAGGMALLPLGMRVLRAIEGIMHDELTRIEGQEVRTPVLQPLGLWEQSGRATLYGSLIARLENRAGQSLVVGPTHEEVMTELARRTVDSYRQLPILAYQIHTKYRDELRVRGGLVRLREFTMLDAYSFDSDETGLATSFERVGAAFERIFARCGVSVVAVEAATGEIGGSRAIEYMALSESGEDTLIVCSVCDYAANQEAARHAEMPLWEGEAPPMVAIATPNCTTIAELAAFIGIAESATAKAVFFDTPERGLIFVVIRGDLAVNEARLCAAAGVSALNPASVEIISASGAVAGYASPVGLTGVTVIADHSVVAAGPLVAGANRVGWHLQHVTYGRDWEAAIIADIADLREGDACPACGAGVTLQRGIEVGHIFQIGTRYTEVFEATVAAISGDQQAMWMGSYGIGLERLMHVIIEQHHDTAGIIWPLAVTPFEIHVVRLGQSETVLEAAEVLIAALEAAGWRVLYDDRNESAGVKFNDADLIGIPWRLTISERGLKNGTVEIKHRASGAIEHLELADCSAYLRERIDHVA